MKNQKNRNYFVGLDIGTNSIGYAVTDENYKMIKYRQHPAWGVHLFESAKLAQERRTFRAARRRLDRRQQRIQLLRELFAKEIACIDARFFQRIDASSLKKQNDEIPYAVFADQGYTDRDFYKQYPTIHHLISELIESEEPHDLRLVYVACAWLLAHRGHFFSDVSKEKVDEINSKGKGKAVGVLCDVRDYNQVTNACKTCVDSFGRIDIVCNFAGGTARRVLNVPGNLDFPDVPIDVFDWGLDVNLKGPFYFARKYPRLPA